MEPGARMETQWFYGTAGWIQRNRQGLLLVSFFFPLDEYEYRVTVSLTDQVMIAGNSVMVDVKVSQLDYRRAGGLIESRHVIG